LRRLQRLEQGPAISTVQSLRAESDLNVTKFGFAGNNPVTIAYYVSNAFMKNVILVILLVSSVLGFGLYLREVNKVTETKAALAVVQTKAEELEHRVTEQETRAASLQTRLKETRVTAVSRADEVTQLQQALTNSATAATTGTGTNGKANPMAEMFKNPEMKNFIKAQQKTVLGGMIDKNYASFFSTLTLTPEQSASFKDLIMKRSMIDAGAGMEMMSGELDPEQRAELTKKTKADKDAIDQELKQFLGDDVYKDFQTYEKYMPERMAIGTFKEQQATGAGALTGDQEAQLISAMSEERKGFNFSNDMYDQSKVANDPKGFFTEEKIDGFLKEQAKLNEQYVTRAGSILTPEQMPAFEKFLKTQSDMQKVGMQMAAKMFGDGKK
jgi:hypothetical protein